MFKWRKKCNILLKKEKQTVKKFSINQLIKRSEEINQKTGKRKKIEQVKQYKQKGYYREKKTVDEKKNQQTKKMNNRTFDEFQHKTKQTKSQRSKRTRSQTKRFIVDAWTHRGAEGALSTMTYGTRSGNVTDVEKQTITYNNNNTNSPAGRRLKIETITNHSKCKRARVIAHHLHLSRRRKEALSGIRVQLNRPAVDDGGQIFIHRIFICSMSLCHG